jgi:hypothetical protein
VLTAETTRFETNRLGLYSDGLRLEWDLKSNTEELFDPHTDPNEQVDLSKSRPQDLLSLEKKLMLALGTPWEALQAGTVSAAHVRMKKGKKTSVPGAILVDRGAPGPQRVRKLEVEVGERFAVLPYDAELSFTPTEGSLLGPWQAEGGRRPERTDPIRLHLGEQGTGRSSLDESQQEALEALGYIQE